MRNTILRSFAVIGVGLAVLLGVLYVATTVDARPPEVLEVRLTQALPSDPRRAPITSSIEVAFSEPVDQEGAAAALRITPEVEGSISWSGTTMTFTPAEPLALETEFEVSIEPGVTDESGNVMTEASEPFSFTTTGRPMVVESDPADGDDGVALQGPILLTFSTLMDTSAVEGALELAPLFPHELRWSGEQLEIVPTLPLAPDRAYEVTIGSEAADAAGVTLGDPFELAFETIEPGLRAQLVVPADDSDGISGTSPLAVFFAEAIDPASVTPDIVSVEPAVAGSIDLVELPGTDGASVLRFTPSAPLPPNTTFEVELSAEIRSAAGGQLAEPETWSFTTGAPLSTLSNQLVFVSARSGVPNLWAMNPDGTGSRQLSAELSPVIDYAVAPDGRSFVVADGRRLVFHRPDGSERRVLTEEGVLEFDPAYAPDSRRIVFGRAAADSGVGLGLWEQAIDAADAAQIELPPELGSAPATAAPGSST
ncbi:MAG: Ig-like domain-containing protein, partial [Candidatus Limnocylindria bacterium]